MVNNAEWKCVSFTSGSCIVISFRFIYWKTFAARSTKLKYQLIKKAFITFIGISFIIFLKADVDEL